MRCKLLLLVVMCAASMVCLGTSQAGGQRTDAGDKKTGKDDSEKRLAKAIENGPGVCEVKTDDKGRITSVWVVGQARISNVLGKVKGIQDAKSKARLAANGEYVKWLKAKVDIHEKSEEETILFLEGSEGNDGKTLKESGKSVEKGSKTIEVIAQNLVRGMEVVHTDSKDGVYTVIYLWTAEKAKALEGK
jgi:hypothetical protein